MIIATRKNLLKLIRNVIKEEKEQSPPILLAKPFSMKDIKTVVSEVLEEMVGKNDKV